MNGNQDHNHKNQYDSGNRVPTRRIYVQSTHLLGTEYQALDIPRDIEHPTSDFERLVTHQIVIPARMVDILTDGLIWLGWSTGIIATLNQLNVLLHPFILLLMVVAIVMLLCLSVYWLKNLSDTRVQGSLVYRWFLIFLGSCLGVISS